MRTMQDAADVQRVVEPRSRPTKGAGLVDVGVPPSRRDRKALDLPSCGLTGAALRRLAACLPCSAPACAKQLLHWDVRRATR